MFCFDTLFKKKIESQTCFRDYKPFFIQILINLMCNYSEVKNMNKKDLNEKINKLDFFIVMIQCAHKFSLNLQGLKNKTFEKVSKTISDSFLNDNSLELFYYEIFGNMEESTKNSTETNINNDTRLNRGFENHDLNTKNDQTYNDKAVENDKGIQKLYDYQDFGFFYKFYKDAESYLNLNEICEEKQMSDSFKKIYDYFEQMLTEIEISKLEKLFENCNNKKPIINRTEFTKFDVIVLTERKNDDIELLRSRHNEFFKENLA
ncbi:hypothetical protein GVAV_001708 [Gurleya vavrai]